MRIYIKLLLALIVSGITFFTSLASANTQKPTNIGIIVPLEHAALQAIINGFEKTLEAEYKQPVKFHVGNAMGDTNLQRSVIQQFMNQKMDMFVPIGLATAQMTLTMVKETPIVTLAADYPETERQNRTPRNVTGVYDELGGATQMKFLRGAFPALKKMTLIHSNAEKIFQEVADIKAIAKKEGIAIQVLVVNTLPDLYSVSKTIAADSQAILMLKDHLIVSGVRTVAQIADARKIPLVAADEGSVSNGAAMALGVSETAIGVQGARLAAKVLSGTSIADLPMEAPARPNIFINKAAATRQGLNIENAAAYGEKNQYALIEISEKTP